MDLACQEKSSYLYIIAPFPISEGSFVYQSSNNLAPEFRNSQQTAHTTGTWLQFKRLCIARDVIYLRRRTPRARAKVRPRV